MPVWRCPHCNTPQAEASRCWVCRQSTTSCVTCRHYRRGISGDLGLCGLAPQHPVVAATDVRECWVAARAGAPGPGPGPLDWLAGDGGGTAPGRPHRTFVPVEADTEVAPVAVMAPTAADTEPEPVAVMAQAPTTGAAARPVPGRWWLWGDPEPWPER